MLLAHARFGVFQSGAAGVEVFFTLSGFLITSLLLQDIRRSDSISFSRFYVRRGLRLVPCLVAVILASVVVKTFFPEAIGWHDVFYASTYTMNWARALGATGGGFLGHTWSLSIEEQFYLLWPVVVLCIGRRPKYAVTVLLMVALAVTVYRIAMFHKFGPGRTYNGLDTHADPLMIGSALAFARFSAHPLHTTSRNVLALSVLAFLLFVAPMFGWWELNVQIVGFSVVSICTCILIAECMYPGESFVRRLMEIRWLTWIGRISYGLYLWHYLVYHALRNVDFIWGWRVAFVGIPISFVVAAASYYWLELPFLRMKDRFSAATLPVSDSRNEVADIREPTEVQLATK